MESDDQHSQASEESFALGDFIDDLASQSPSVALFFNGSPAAGSPSSGSPRAQQPPQPTTPSAPRARAQSAEADDVVAEKYHDPPPPDPNDLELSLEWHKVHLSHVTEQVNDCIKLNLVLASDNRNKDAFLLQQETFVKLMEERNKAELDQIELEHQALLDYTTHMFAEKASKVDQLKIKEQRLDDLQSENERLIGELEEITQAMKKEALDHAEALHAMNKDMQSTRIKLEHSFKTEIGNLDHKYLVAAFEELSASHKEAMLQNAKLKDEAIIQSVGMNNLGCRLKAQKSDVARIHKVLDALNAKSDRLRDRLGALSVEKFNRSKEVLELEEQKAKLQQEVDAKQKAKNAFMHKDATLCEEIRLKTRECIERTETWERRYELLQDLDLRLKPTTSDEVVGKYSVEKFPFATIDYGEGPAAAAVDVTSAFVGPRLTEFQQLISSNKFFQSLFEPLRGKEGLVITDAKNRSKGGPPQEPPPHQNMATWTCLEVLRIFQETEGWRKREQLARRSDATQTHHGLSQHRHRQPEDDGSPEDWARQELENEWDDLFSSENELKYFGANAEITLQSSGLGADWYRQPDSPKRLPAVDATSLVLPDLATELRPSKSAGDIVPFRLNSSFGPPVMISGLARSATAGSLHGNSADTTSLGSSAALSLEKKKRAWMAKSNSNLGLLSASLSAPSTDDGIEDLLKKTRPIDPLQKAGKCVPKLSLEKEVKLKKLLDNFKRRRKGNR